MNSCVRHKHDSLTGGVLMAVILCCRVNIVPFPRSIPKISNVPPFISVEYSYRYSWNEDKIMGYSTVENTDKYSRFYSTVVEDIALLNRTRIKVQVEWPVHSDL